MPIPVYSFILRGTNLGSSIRLDSKEEAQVIYDAVSSSIDNNKEFTQLNLKDDVASIRTRDISAFGISVHMEETPEERKQRAIQQIEQQSGYCENYPQGALDKSVYLGSGLL